MVEIIAPDAQAKEAGKQAILEHIAYTFHRPKRVFVELDGDEFKCTLECEKPVIARTRRITGYLSDRSHFGSAKAAEERDRKPHG